jgi:hypothetical protein
MMDPSDSSNQRKKEGDGSQALSPSFIFRLNPAPLDTHHEKIPALRPQPFILSHFPYGYYLAPQGNYMSALPSTESLEERGAAQ